MSLVVYGIYPSVNAAYRAKAEALNVSPTAVYDKLNGVEVAVSRALVRETAAQMASVIELMGETPELLDGVSLVKSGTGWRSSVLAGVSLKANNSPQSLTIRCNLKP